MAEFLLYNKDHWMDALSQAEIDAHIANNKHFQQKYDSRYQKGDVIEVRNDGYWTDGKRKGFGAPTFALMTVPGMSLEEAKKYVEPQETVENAGLENEVRTTIKRRKYQIDLVQTILSADKKAEAIDVASAHIVDKSKV